jgi:hypothetical protein
MHLRKKNTNLYVKLRKKLVCPTDWDKIEAYVIYNKFGFWPKTARLLTEARVGVTCFIST